MKLVYDSFETPLGEIHVMMDEIGLAAVELTAAGWLDWNRLHPELSRDKERCRQAIGQLEEYFQGGRREFDVPLSLRGPEFSCKVWRELTKIPYGETRSYVQVAMAVGNPKACRAVGGANRRNPIPIVIPCHRVIGKDGSLTGYIGKGYLGMKEYLLQMEQEYQLKGDTGL